jgi:PAB-dependent poly(A)-specific ribonuclease subunit 3
MKKSFNVDSPSFTPSFLSATDNVNVNANVSVNGKKSTGISPKAANAAPFLPKSAAASSRRVPDRGGWREVAVFVLTAPTMVGADTSTPDWTMDVQEFIPQSYNSGHLVSRPSKAMKIEGADLAACNSSTDLLLVLTLIWC